MFLFFSYTTYISKFPSPLSPFLQISLKSGKFWVEIGDITVVIARVTLSLEIRRFIISRLLQSSLERFKSGSAVTYDFQT